MARSLNKLKRANLLGTATEADEHVERIDGVREVGGYISRLRFLGLAKTRCVLLRKFLQGFGGTGNLRDVVCDGVVVGDSASP